MQALVTGGAGFLGRYIVEQLLARGDQVRVISRGNYPELSAQGAELITGDVRDPSAVQRACREIETVFHVAAVPGVWGSYRHYHTINTVGTQNVIDACQKWGVQKLIYTSSPSVVFDGQPHLNANEELPYPAKYLCHYPQSKARGEQAVLKAHAQQGLLTCALRPHLVWGPRDNHLLPRLLQRARSGRLRQVGAGKNLISMTYVENGAAAHLQAADALTPTSAVGGQAYFINEPEPVNLWDWINELLMRAGIPALKKKISTASAYLVGGMLEAIYGTLRLTVEPPMTRFVALQLSQSHTYSINKAQQDFHFKPIVDYHTAISRLEADFPRIMQNIAAGGN